MAKKVVIIGGGVIGASCLYHLSMNGVTDVYLFEKGSYGNASTGKSAGIVETQYVDKDEIELRAKSMPLFLKFKEEDNLPLEKIGYMRLGRQEEDKAGFENSVKIQEAFGAKSVVLSPEQVKEIVPDLDIEGIKSALFGPDDAYLDPYLLTSIYIEKAKERGAKAYQNTTVTGIRIEEGCVRAVETDKGTFECDYIVNAAGAWAEKVGRMVNLELPVKGYRRQIVVLDAPGINYTVPAVMDYVPGKEREGLYFREERGNKIFAGLHWEAYGNSEEAVDPDSYNEKVDQDYVEKIAERLMEKVPGFSELGLQNGWAGLYPITPDTKPIVGEMKEVKGFINCIGFGGNGVQLSPVFGQAICDLIIKGTTDAIKLEKYSIYRFNDVSESKG